MVSITLCCSVSWNAEAELVVRLHDDDLRLHWERVPHLDAIVTLPLVFGAALGLG